MTIHHIDQLSTVQLTHVSGGQVFPSSPGAAATTNPGGGKDFNGNPSTPSPRLFDGLRSYLKATDFVPWAGRILRGDFSNL